MGEREDDYEDKLILLVTGNLMRYRILKTFIKILTLPIVFPLVIISKVGECSEYVYLAIQRAEFLIRHQVVWRFRWNELARENYKRQKERDDK